jgi:group I intron endonuclease
MGIIYKITSPSGKIYIGQTIQCLDKRWKQHVDAARRVYKDNCKVLNKSIRKYGDKHFKIEILEECLDNDLDTKEIEYIEKFNSVIPNGMNIKLGGSNGKHHQTTKDKISELVLKETREKLSENTNPDLPMYLIRTLNGYRVCNHPMGPEKRFISKTKTDEYNLHRALKYLEKLNNLKEPLIVEKSISEKYIQKHRNGYCVKFLSEKPKYFVSKQISNEILYQSALNYLNELKSKSAVQRLNVSG